MIEIKVDIKNGGESNLEAEGTLKDIFSEGVIAVVSISKILEDKIPFFEMEDLFELAKKNKAEILKDVCKNETKTVQLEKSKDKSRAVEDKLIKLIKALKDAVYAANKER